MRRREYLAAAAALLGASQVAAAESDDERYAAAMERFDDVTRLTPPVQSRLEDLVRLYDADADVLAYAGLAARDDEVVLGLRDASGLEVAG